MTRKIITLIALSAIFLTVKAQSVVSFDMLQRNMNVKVKLTLKDAKTSEPITWASVYLIPQGDTTITHFALSDDKGDVELKEVPTGKYELNAEMIGYLPHKKVYTFKNWSEDLGIIKMEENQEYLDAAKVTAAGNAIQVKEDTIIFNASSFKVGENDMLADLLNKMPGIEVGSDGSVSVNGEKVNKITVGGKTFFFDDPTAALKNLPAKIVDKVKIVDKDKDSAEFTGISTKDDKEKVMDVELKEEYTKGWFGNAALGAGTDGERFLYNGNAMVSGYTEKDQIVFLGHGYNASEPGASVVIYSTGNEDNEFASMNGINSSAQAGVNYSTERIKGFDANASVNYKKNAKDVSTSSARTSYQNDGPDIHTDGLYEGFGNDNSLTVTVEVEKKDKKKHMLYFVPTFKYTDSRINSSNTSRTYTEEQELNQITSVVSSHTSSILTSGWLGAGIKDIGKERRSLSMDMEYQFSNGDGKRDESGMKNLHYDNTTGQSTIGVGVTYVEPFGKKWALQTYLASSYMRSNSRKDAFNPDGSTNTYYTSASDNIFMQERLRMLMEYKTDTVSVQFGLIGDLANTTNRATSMGKESITGKGEWLFNWSPFAAFRYKLNSQRVNLYYNGYTRQVSARQLSPALDISNPLQITTGNIYLKPSYDSHISASYSMNDRETFSFLNVNLYGTINNNSIVHASWFDSEGIRYAVPVNSRRPGSTTSLYVSYNIPLGKERRFTFSTNGNASISRNTSYQAKTQMEGMNLSDFDYNSFLSEFWGNASGDRFYRGESGFSESRTNTFNWSLRASLKYSIDKFDLTVSARTGNRTSRYSLNPDADINTWNSSTGFDAIYTPGKDWEIKTDLRYRFYHGYTAGYGKPEWNWNMSVSKSFKSVTLSLKAFDILNQTRNLQRTVSGEYMEDVYSLVLGRYIMASVSFNFGKMNAKKNSNVENAMWRGMW